MIIFCFYSISFGAFFSIAISKLSKTKISGYMVAIWSLIFTMMICVDYELNLLPTMGDSIIYAEIIRTGGGALSLSKGYYGFLLIMNLIRPWVLFSPIGFVAIQSSIYLGCLAMLIAHAKRVYGSTKKQLIIFSFLVLCYPAFFVFFTSPLRESFFLLGFSIVFSSRSIQNTHLKIISICVGLAICAMIRAQFAPSLLISVFISKWKPRLSQVALLVVLLPVFFIICQFAIKITTGYQITPSGLSALRNSNVISFLDSGKAYGAVEWNDWIDVMKDFPLLIIQYVCAPLPVLSKLNPLDSKILLLDALYILAAIAVILVNFQCAIKKCREDLIFLFPITILPALYEFYLYDACRHRVPTGIILFLIASHVVPLRKRRNDQNSREEKIRI